MFSVILCAIKMSSNKTNFKIKSKSNHFIVYLPATGVARKCNLDHFGLVLYSRLYCLYCKLNKYNFEGDAPLSG